MNLIHIVNPEGNIDMSRISLPAYIGTWRSSLPENGVTLQTAGAKIEDGIAAVRSIYPNIEVFGIESEAARAATNYRRDRIVLQPVHLGTGEVGRKRRAALEAMAEEAGYHWNGKPSIGRWLVSLADEKIAETES